ncbi:MAG: elongation factor Ts [Candidatus Parcubacteria bacterium]|jgi:elongation factor Ts
MVNMDIVKQLRDETGVAIMQCKKALEEVGGDIEKAKVILRKVSAQAAAKKADRTLGAGAVQAAVAADKKSVAAVVLACETDFVARNPEFIAVAKAIAEKAITEQNGNLAEHPDVVQMVNDAVQKFGEKTQVAQVVFTQGAVVNAYVHSNNTVAAVVALQTTATGDALQSLAYDIAMHTAAMAPKFVSREQVQESDITAAKAIFEEEAAGKPAEMKEKIVAGKIEAYLKEKVLLEQPFVKSGEQTIKKVVETASAAAGAPIQIVMAERLSV